MDYWTQRAAEFYFEKCISICPYVYNVLKLSRMTYFWPAIKFGKFVSALCIWSSSLQMLQCNNFYTFLEVFLAFYFLFYSISFGVQEKMRPFPP